MLQLNRFIMEEVELPLVPVVADMEAAGYLIAPEHFRQLRERLKPDMEAVTSQIREVAGPDFNPKSPPQVRKLLFETLGLKPQGMTAKGMPSTNGAALERLKDEHPVIPLLQRCSDLAKIISTYCKFPEQVEPDGRLHVAFNQLAAETGRFSSPGVIQQLPKHNNYRIRDGFIASPRFQIVGADFDQQELKVLASASEDEALLAAIAAAQDLHGVVAVKVFKLNCEPNEVKAKFPAERDKTKAIQFGLVYGSTSYALAQRLGITDEEARKLIFDYFTQFPRVKGFIAQVHAAAVRDGHVTDMFGRRRFVPDAQLKRPRKNWQKMSEAERKLIRRINRAKRQSQNFVIQGAAATITKLAMIRCHRHITAEHPDIKLLLTLHDEIQFEVPKSLVDHFAAEIPDLMCNLGLDRFGFKAALTVEVKTGASWGTLSKWRGNS